VTARQNRSVRKEPFPGANWIRGGQVPLECQGNSTVTRVSVFLLERPVPSPLRPTECAGALWVVWRGSPCPLPWPVSSHLPGTLLQQWISSGCSALTDEILLRAPISEAMKSSPESGYTSISFVVVMSMGRHSSLRRLPGLDAGRAKKMIAQGVRTRSRGIGRLGRA
jgi:hypothetical protein